MSLNENDNFEFDLMIRLVESGLEMVADKILELLDVLDLRLVNCLLTKYRGTIRLYVN